MAKICINQNCKKEIPSSATFCSFCGTQQVEDIQLSEEEKLRKEMSEMQETITLLKKALVDAQQNSNPSAEKEQKIAKLQTQLEAVEEKKKRTDEEHKFISKPLHETNNKKMFRHPFSFKGRIRRTEYCLSFLIYLIWYSAIIINMTFIGSEGFAVLLLLFLIPMTWFLYAQGAKRCHDRNKSGWSQIIPLYVFWLLFAKGDNKINDYGEPPK
jgi:uncharacterized membrane protein YhaH (DUF805 family)